MTPHEWDALLKQTLADAALSRKERQALDAALAGLGPDDAQRGLLRSRAFAVAREALGSVPPGEVLDWLEGVVKALERPAAPAAGEVSVAAHFSPWDNCPAEIMRLIDRARRTADLCVFTITDDRIAEAVCKAHGRGVRVRVITDNHKAEDLGSDIADLCGRGIPVHFDPDEHHMHHKFAVFDDAVLLTGSYNWTRSAGRFNRENLLVTDDPRLVAAYRRAFERLWGELAR